MKKDGGQQVEFDEEGIQGEDEVVIDRTYI